MKVKAVKIDTLALDSDNARKHSDRNLLAIKESLSRFGQRKPIVVRGSKVLAGNGTLEAARALGWTEIQIAEAPDDWDEDTAKAYALADNRTAELAEWDESVLARQLLELEDAEWDIEALGFELPKLHDIDVDKDEIPEPPTEPVTKLGDIWQIGQHRIMCGDSLDDNNLNRLSVNLTIKCILTDPPYGIDLNTDYSASGGKKYKRVANDDRPFDAGFLRNKFKTVQEQFWFGANYYHRTLCADDLEGSWLVWDKRTEDTDSVIGSAFELCWSAQKHKQDVLRYHWTNFTSHHNAGERRAHPTEKPVAMLVEILERWCEAQSVVIDMFAGSGTTLVAAAKTNRIGIGMELDPSYVDVIVTRLENITGEKATLLNKE